MFTLFTATAIFGAFVSKSLAQSCEYSDLGCSDEPYSDPYSEDPYATPTGAFGNAISDYPEVESLLSAIAPQVTSISPDQASMLDDDLYSFQETYTIDNPLPTILSKDPREYLENDPSQTIDSSKLDRIEDLMEYPTDSAAMSDLASILSGNPASSFVMAYETAAASYQNAIYSAIAPLVYNDLALSGSASVPSQTAMSSFFMSTTLGGVSLSLPTTLRTSTGGSSSASVSATRTGSSSSSRVTSTSTSTSAPISVSSALAAPTAGPQIVLSAVAAAAGLIGMAIL